MAIAKIQSPLDETQKLLTSFARSQLSAIDPKSIKKNSFQLFSIAAFLFGAIAQLGKQSTLPDHLIRDYLQRILGDEFELPQHNSEGLVSSIYRMMEEYYLLENIYHEGESAAEKWLTDDNAECQELKNLLHNYRDFTLMDMKAAGMKNNTGVNELQTQVARNSRTIWPALLTASAVFVTVLTILYYTLIVN